MGFTDDTIEDMVAGDWTLNVQCGGCQRTVELTPNYFRRNGDAFQEPTISKMRWRCTKCGERERFKLTTFKERFRGDKARLKVYVIVDRTGVAE